jgi:hypothetical protein
LGSGSRRLLLIEKDAGLHKALTEVLESVGHQVVHGDPASGERSFGEIDVVVLGLPVSPAWCIEELPRAPLVLLHGRAVLGELERWLDPPHPCSRILLSRPFRDTELLDAVERAWEAEARARNLDELRS